MPRILALLINAGSTKWSNIFIPNVSTFETISWVVQVILNELRDKFFFFKEKHKYSIEIRLCFDKLLILGYHLYYIG